MCALGCLKLDEIYEFVHRAEVKQGVLDEQVAKVSEGIAGLFTNSGNWDDQTEEITGDIVELSITLNE